MNQVFIDNSLLALALITSTVVSKTLKSRKTSLLFAIFLFFPPLVVFLNMWAHTTAVFIMNIRRYNAGTFQYNFTVYSHFLFGIVFILLSGLTIHLTKKYIGGDRKQKHRILWANLVTSLFFLPVVFINPIGTLPVIASLVSSLLLWTWYPFKKRGNDLQDEKLSEGKTAILSTHQPV